MVGVKVHTTSILPFQCYFLGHMLFCWTARLDWLELFVHGLWLCLLHLWFHFVTAFQFHFREDSPSDSICSCFPNFVGLITVNRRICHKATCVSTSCWLLKSNGEWAWSHFRNVSQSLWSRISELDRISLHCSDVSESTLVKFSRLW